MTQPNPNTTEAAKRLEPCPFCIDGGKPQTAINSQGGYLVGCFACMADGPTMNTWQDAVRAWNTRPEYADDREGEPEDYPDALTADQVSALAAANRSRFVRQDGVAFCLDDNMVVMCHEGGGSGVADCPDEGTAAVVAEALSAYLAAPQADKLQDLQEIPQGHEYETALSMLKDMEAEAMPIERRAAILAQRFVKPNDADRAWASQAVKECLTTEGQGVPDVATAYYDGFVDGLVRSPWEDAADWAALQGQAYAKSGDRPPFIPISAHPATPPYQLDEAMVEQIVREHFYTGPVAGSTARPTKALQAALAGEAS